MTNHNSTGSNRHAFPNLDFRNNFATDTQKAQISNSHIPCQCTLRRDVHCLTDPTVVVDCCSRINDGEILNHRFCIDDDTGHYRNPTPKGGAW